MGSFEGKYWKIYLDEKTRERRDEILDHLKAEYNGPSDFTQQALMDEQAMSLEERIERKQQDIEEQKNELQQLKQIHREREQQDKLRDKKELLKEKQRKLRKIQRRGNVTEEDALCNAATQVWNTCVEKAGKPKNSDVSARDLFSKDRYQRRVQHFKQKQLESSEDVDQLVEDVQRLQGQVAELNGGREDWFLDLQGVEVSA